MLENILQEMVKGNFSFLILVFSVAQTILMAKNMRANKGTRDILTTRRRRR